MKQIVGFVVITLFLDVVFNDGKICSAVYDTFTDLIDWIRERLGS